ncbi:signal peptidase I [Quadrisphaera sp. DSM 44207]|uniref:signal peptidase I n=1 Tax=Quadrisphaera sp. DSM 44207 TaxID=1881057 RepID=UPI000884B956|nr:signal peptidase I [Quadrisphaera sp. DSM 44207]SDQ71812.1 signal peptidase I [Quadrisphaera sp. DSM 44207]
MGVVHVGLAAVLAVLVVLGLRAQVAEPVRVVGDSMSPTLDPGDVVLVDKRGECCERGDLVAFTSPRDGALTVKRVAGTSGDVVAIEGGVLVVDGERVREPYVDPESVDALYYGPVTVPPGSLLVLGDARGESIDSRDHGPVPASSVTGRVALGLWPPSWSAG